MTSQITKDLIYDAVAPNDFAALIEVDRYGSRSDAFDKIIQGCQDHFWDPLDPRYIDFSEPFDIENEMIIPEELVPSLQTDLVGSKIQGKDRVRFVNEITHWILSSILHGEQGALSLSASLCNILRDPGAQEYAANQAREEARHVTAFTKYIQVRWGKPMPAGPTLTNLLTEIVQSPAVYKKIIGMQMLVEGLAMGGFATLYSMSNDPVLVRLTQLAMTDEAVHNKFGKIWAMRTMPHLSEEEHNIIEDWAAECFQILLFNLINPEQMPSVYQEFGLDPQEVMEAMAEVWGDDERREEMRGSTNIFRVLIKTLLKSGIITDRTKSIYSFYVDMEELKAEGDTMVGDAIADEGIKFLKTVDRNRKHR